MPDSFVDTIGVGAVTAPGGLKVFGVLVDYEEVDNQQDEGSPYSYLGTANVSASEIIEPVTVTSAGNIAYSWNVTAVAAIQLYTDGNSASGNATAEATAGMNLGPVPTAAPEEGL